MNIKTPKFNEVLDEVLKNLKPHKKSCVECQKEFEIFAEDIEFYKKLQVPPPTLCFGCRLQRKLAYRSSPGPIFYKKSCSAPDHTEKIIAYFSEQNPVKVYDDQYYLSDQWEATEFASEVDSNNSFFSQFENFALTVPHQSLFKDPKSMNCDYVTSGVEAKDCYYVSTPYLSEKIYYGRLPVRSKECVDIVEVNNSENIFDSNNLINCYKCISCIESSDCIDSSFLYDCKNCQNCFLSSNLRNKLYYFNNQQLSKEKYQERMKKITLGRRSVYNKFKKEFDGLIKKSIKKNVWKIKTENCIGDDIQTSKNCFYSFGIKGESENTRYAVSVDKVSNLMDIYGSAKSSEAYDSTAIVSGNGVKFSFSIRTGVDIEYCGECNNCEYCFGCFGLRNKKFCIFNKQYDEEKYWKEVDKLKIQMLAGGEYGEFFPLKYSAFPYRDSHAQIEFPLTEREIKKNGWHWQNEIESDLDLSQMNVIQAKDISDDIKDITNDVLQNTAILCERTKKPFRITAFELAFYRKMDVPLPTIHPLERIKDLFKHKRHYKLYSSTCTKCEEEIQTVHNPEITENIWCEKCYQQEVI